MNPDTGTPTAQILAASNDAGWARVLPMMQAGAVLRWNTETQRAYVDGHGSLTWMFVRRLVADGVIREVGFDAWRLKNG